MDRVKAEVEQAEAAAQVARARFNQATRPRDTAEDASALCQPRRHAGVRTHGDQGRIDTAPAARAAAEAEVAQAQAGVKVARAGAEIAQAGVRRCRRRRGFTKIVAPFDGVVTRLTVDVGTTVRSGRAKLLAVAVMRDDVVQVYFDVEELSVPKVEVTCCCRLIRRTGRIRGEGDAHGGGRGSEHGHVRAYVVLPNPDGKLKPGMFANVEVKTDGAGK